MASVEITMEVKGPWLPISDAPPNTLVLCGGWQESFGIADGLRWKTDVRVACESRPGLFGRKIEDNAYRWGYTHFKPLPDPNGVVA